MNYKMIHISNVKKNLFKVIIESNTVHGYIAKEHQEHLQ